MTTPNVYRLFCTISIMLIVVSPALATPFPIAVKGNLLPHLVVDPGLAPEVAADLSRVLEHGSGGAFAQVAPADSPAIVVGPKSFAAFGGRYDQLEGPDTVQIAVVGNQLHLVGSTAEAAGHAVYTFLDDLGCRWFMPGSIGEVLPVDANLTWTGKERVEKPSFYLRELWWAYGGPPETAEDFRIWRLRNRMAPRRIAHGHNLTNTVPPATYLSAHPEYYALVKGTRQNTQLCTSNPEVIRLSIEHITEYFDQNPEMMSYSLCPDDNKDFCECAACTALDTGKHEEASLGGAPIITDRLLAYLNAVAQGIQGKHPGKSVTCYAYLNYSTPPEREPVDPHVNIVLTTSVYCSAHSIGDANCDSRQLMKQDLAGWAKVCPNTFIYEYDPTPYNAELPWPMYGTHARAYPVYEEMGIKGFSYEGHDSWATLFPNFYIAARMMWDAHADYDALITDLCRGFYGPAAKPMRAYLQTMDETIRQFPERVGWGQLAYPKIFTEPVIATCRQYINEAEAVATDDATRSRIRMTSLGFDYFETYLKVRRVAEGHVDFDAYVELRKACDDKVRAMHALNKDYIVEQVALDYLDRELGQAASKYYATEMGLVSRWMLVGPFDNENGEGHGKSYPPEENLNFSDKYKGKNGQEVAWLPFKGQSWSGLVDLAALFSPTDWSTAYAACYVTSPVAQTVQFRMGSNDTLKVWLNDAVVWESTEPRGLTVDSDTVGVTLPEGRSRILLKVSNAGKSWGFCFRITDNSGTALKGLKYSLDPGGI